MRGRYALRGRVVVGSLLSLLLLVGTASADSRPPLGVHVVGGSASTTKVNGGAIVAFAGSGFEPATFVRLSVDGTVKGGTNSTADGRIAFRFLLPGSGTATVAATGTQAGGMGVQVVTVNVVLPPPETYGSTGLAKSQEEASSQIYIDLGAGLAFVLFAVMVAIAMQAGRRRS